MLAVLQFDGVSLPRFHELLSKGRLPAIAKLRRRGHWVSLEAPSVAWEGAIYHSLYSGKGLTEHGLYSPLMWEAAEQRVRSRDAYPAPEPIWDRIGKVGRRSLVIDPYEGRQATSVKGIALSGWQFRHKITLRKWSVPEGLNRQLERRFGRPPLVEEIYGLPSARYLLRMRNRLLTAPKRVADISAALFSEASFDLTWITLSASHIAGHWFLDPSRLPWDHYDEGTKTNLDQTISDSYVAVDEALSDIVDALPPNTDIIVLSASAMGPNSSRTHLLPGMLQAVLSATTLDAHAMKTAGTTLWRLRAAVPTTFRALVARVLPDQLVMDLTAFLSIRGVNWSNTRAFMVPSLDCGYIRLNLKGREREGIVDPKEADTLLEQIASGLHSFCDSDGAPAIKKIEFASSSFGYKTLFYPVPDLIVHWSERLPPQLGGVYSPKFGEINCVGWGSGRTGEHCDGAWALIVPGTSHIRSNTAPPHILDIAPTICSVLRVDRTGLSGQPLLEPSP